MALRECEPDEVADLVAGGALLLDVREESEWQLGHAALASHLPLADVPDRLAELPRDRLILCVCRSGGRSTRAAHFLAEEGFEVANVTGGMLAWQARGLPLEADNGAPLVD